MNQANSMVRFVICGIVLLMCSTVCISAQIQVPALCGPVPSENQLRWQELEYYAFIHFSLNTYTDQSWGYGNEDVNLFNPTELDCRQWARICKEAGMKAIILTVKHHCGFCLWPSKYTEYSVKNAPWRDGKGDVVREMADACKEYGLKLGIYLSPWDRNHPEYGRPEYITYFRNQLTELLTNYGPIFEVWFDGANGGTGYYGGANENRKIDRTTYYDWSNTYKLIRELQPDIVIWNDGGNRADLRWVGTEAGFIGETNWSLLNATGDVPFNMLHHGVEDGDSWVPGEVNTSIRPEWFYHPSEDTKVKTLPHLMDTYYNSIGRNATLLLNFPIMPNGLIHENDEKAALDLAKAVKEAFAVNLARQTKAEASNVRGNAEESAADNVIDSDKDTYWATDDDVTKASLTLDFGKPTTFNRFMAQEYIRLGQRVKAFTIEGLIDGNWKELAKATTVGYKRILRFPTVAATQLRFNINDAKCCPVISNIGVYNAPQILTSPTDYMPTAFDLKEMVGYTWAHLLAQAVNMTSPLLHFAGKYQDFIGNPAENLLRHLPSTWDETIVLSGSEIGKTVGFARRRGDTWFIGVLNGGEAATLPIELSFLEQGTWQAEVFGDDPGHPATFQRQSNNVRASDSLTVSMSPRGGAVIGLTKTTP